VRRIAVALLALLSACPEPATPPSTTPDSVATDAATDSTTDTGAEGDASAPVPVVAEPGASRYAFVGDEVAFSATASTGAVAYAWDFGDGSSAEGDAVSASYAEPGRYQVVLTATGPGGKDSASLVVSVTQRPSWTPRESGSVLRVPEPQTDEQFLVVSPDSDEVVLVNREQDDWSVGARVTVCGGPRTVAAVLEPDVALVACPDADTVEEVTFSVVDAQVSRAITFPRGSRPFGVVVDGTRAFVALQGTGELAVLDLTMDPPPMEVFAAVPDARGVALWPDGRVAVSRWRSPSTGGAVVLVDPDTGAVESLTLQVDPQISSDTEVGGVPNYLDQILVSPQGDEAALPHTQMNIFEGVFQTGDALRHDTVLRGTVSFLGTDGVEDFAARKQFDNRGLASAAAWSSRGDYLFVAMRGSRAVERYDRLASNQSGSLLFVGFAPSGLALSADDRFLVVDAALSREIVIYDVTDFSTLPQPVARLPLVEQEPLPAQILKGKQLFNDSFDARLTKDGYLACAHCHLDGNSDGQTWDFTDRGEGLRNTPTLLGRAGVGDGPVHWTANFDEIQDFENDIRGHFDGTGLLSDADFEATRETLGAPKAGLSEDLDALAAYVTTLAEDWVSPHCGPDGALTPEAQAGKALFDSVEVGCAGCHSGPRFTDSGAELYDVGTLTAASGQRLGGPLPGIDTPSLVASWATPPYLHDGSAATLMDVLTVANEGDLHGVTSPLTPQELADLVAYLRCL